MTEWKRKISSSPSLLFWAESMEQKCWYVGFCHQATSNITEAKININIKRPQIWSKKAVWGNEHIGKKDCRKLQFSDNTTGKEEHWNGTQVTVQTCFRNNPLHVTFHLIQTSFCYPRSSIWLSNILCIQLWRAPNLITNILAKNKPHRYNAESHAFLFAF